MQGFRSKFKIFIGDTFIRAEVINMKLDGFFHVNC